MNLGIAVTDRIPRSEFDLDIEAAVGKHVLFISETKLLSVFRVFKQDSFVSNTPHIFH